MAGLTPGTGKFTRLYKLEVAARLGDSSLSGLTPHAADGALNSPRRG